MTSVIFLNTGKPTREQIKEKFFSSEFYLITDEEAFVRHLFRKWMKMGEKEYVVRYQTTVKADGLFEAIKKAGKYDGLELFEVKEIFLKGDIDE